MKRVRSSHLSAALLALTVAAYLPLWNNDFVDFDDELYITRNARVKEGLNGSGFQWAWTTFHGVYWQPVTWLSLQFDAHFFSTEPAGGERRLSPAAFHGQNLFWHGASALLLFGLWSRLTGARWRSFLVAALFAVHPMHVESVAWATERKDVLSTFFGILTLSAYVRYLEKPGWKRYLGVGSAFFLSLLSKPMLMTLPFVLLLMDYWPLGRMFKKTSPPAAGPMAAASFGRLVLEKLPLFVLAAGIGIVTVVAREQARVAIPLNVIPLSARLANAMTAYGWYLASTFWPVNLAVLYPHPFDNWSMPAALAGMITFLAISALACWQARRRPWLITGWLWFAGTLVPVIGLVQGGQQAWADRFSYWPHIGLFVVLTWGLGELVHRLRIPAWVSATQGLLVLGCLAFLTWIQVGYWHDTGTLWKRALAVTEDHHLAHVHLGKYYQERGRLDVANAHLTEAVQSRPNLSEYQNFLGGNLLLLGRVEEAAGHLTQSLSRDPNYTDAWQNLGVARLRQRRLAAAIHCFRKVLDREPESVDALTGMGLALSRAGKRQEAVANFQAALRQDPKAAEAWHGLGCACLAQGELNKAIENFSLSLRFSPQLVKTHSDLGLAFERQGNWFQAVSCHQTAVWLADQGEKQLEKMGGTVAAPASIPDIVVFRCRLAGALNQVGDGDGAAREYRAALKREPLWPQQFAAKAWNLATHPDVNFRDPRLAYELANQAIQAVGDPAVSMLDALAAAQAALGNYPDAVKTAQQALANTAVSGEKTAAGPIRERMRLYENGKPFTATE